MFTGFHLNLTCVKCHSKIKGVVNASGCHIDIHVYNCETCKIETDKLKEAILNTIVSPEEQKRQKEIIDSKIKEAYDKGLAGRKMKINSPDEDWQNKDIGG